MPLVLSGDGAVGPLSATEVSYLDGVTSAVQTQINGKLTIPVWTSYTPTITSFTGSITSYTVNSAKYIQINKLVILRYNFTITNNGTGASNIRMTPPVNAVTAGAGSGFGREQASTGKTQNIEFASASSMAISNYDNTYPGGTNYNLVGIVIYEAE